MESPGLEKVTYDGYLSSCGRYEYNEPYFEIFCRAKLKFGLEITENIGAEIGYEANSNTREVELKDACAVFKYSPNFRVKVGNEKRRFGLEEQVSEEDLYTIEKSLINEYISNFGYVGREPSIQVYNKEKTYCFGISYNQSHTAILVARQSWQAGSCKIGLDAQYQRYTGWWFEDGREDYPPNTYAFSFDWATARVAPTYMDLEIFCGLDPFETQYSRFEGDRTDVFFLGIKSLCAPYRSVEKQVLKGIEPLFLFSILFPDCASIGFNKIETLLGINIYFHPDVRFRVNGDLILSTNKYSISNTAKPVTLFGRSVVESKGVLELQLRW